MQSLQKYISSIYSIFVDQEVNRNLLCFRIIFIYTHGFLGDSLACKVKGEKKETKVYGSSVGSLDPLSKE